VTRGDERLAEALRAEHAAIFAYGVIGAHLEAGTVELAQAAELAHRTRRDALVVRLASKGTTPPPSDPVYNLPYAVSDRASALKLAITVEERCAAIWRLVLPDTGGDERKLGLDALLDCATRATRFRAAAGTIPTTVAFPANRPSRRGVRLFT
jgi:hypothetical protein